MSHITSRKLAADRQPRHRSSAALAIAALALPGAALAQAAAAPAASASQAAATLPTVKVQGARDSEFKATELSSPKFTQPIVDTPQTITVIKKELLQQQAATSLAEALRNTPGVTLQLGENGSTQTGDSINLRGFDSSQSIFVDGIRDLGAVSRDVFNIDQVEVVKGPSGSDIGRGASSAYINLVSKTAQLDRFATGTLTAGTASRKRLVADLNQPLDIALPGSAVRLNLMAQDYGTPGRDEVRAKRWGFAPTVAFGLGTPTRLTLSYLHINQDNQPDGGVPTFGMKGYGYGTGTSGPTVRSSNYYGLASDYDHVKVDMFTARIEHDLAPGFKLRNTTRLGQTQETVVVTGVNAIVQPSTDPSTWTATRSRQGRDQDNEIVTNQTNLSSAFTTFGLDNALSTGIELIYERQHTNTPTAVSGATAATGAANLYAPNPNDTLAMPQFYTTGSNVVGSTLTASVYAFDTLNITDDFLVNAGVRGDKFHTDTSTVTAATATVAASAGSLGLTDTLWSWKVGAVFKPARNGSVYATYSDSRQPPGGTNFALSATSSSSSRSDLKPTEGSNVEVGTKWDLLGGKAGFTAAVYRSENKNELVSDGATVPTYSQVGKRRVQGVELGLVGQLTDALNVSVGYSHMDSKILRGTTANTGGVLTFSPVNTFTSWVSYKLPLGFTVGAGERYADTSTRSSNTTPATTYLISAPSYWVTDAMVAYDIDRNWSVQLNGGNLFDRKYMASLNNGGSRYTPGAARNALLSLTAKF
jgi:catecholate siderophore receptor